MQLVNGTTLQKGTYRIEQTLGQGGFGITYRASMEMSISGRLGNIKTNVDVALKEFFMKSTCMRDNDQHTVVVTTQSNSEQTETYKKKFLKEARNMSRLQHPHIAQVLDVFEENNTVYYVLEYLDGGTFLDCLKLQPNHRLEENIAIKYILQIGSALQYMHEEHKMCHYDVKPSNIMLSKHGDAKLIDFGLAKNYDAQGHQTSSTPVAISAGYAPLEQYQQQLNNQSFTADVYSLGATLYTLVVGTPPPDAPSLAVNGFPLRPDFVSERVWTAITSAMQFNIQQRPQSIIAFLSILDESLIKPSPSRKVSLNTITIPKKEKFVSANETRRMDEVVQPNKQQNNIKYDEGNDSTKWWKPIVVAACIVITSYLVFVVL